MCLWWFHRIVNKLSNYFWKHRIDDLIISDDGLQHYKLRRDIEIVVMDAERALGNGFVLPAGPLRELPSRLKSVDFVITNGGKNAYSDAIMQLVPHYTINLVTAEKRLLGEFTQGSAIAGIGNPQRFFYDVGKFKYSFRKYESFFKIINILSRNY